MVAVEQPPPQHDGPMHEDSQDARLNSAEQRIKVQAVPIARPK